ncbi:hypothetical protein EK904_003466 [Melospiza melodia maxima]|nr:hypothetical protein EK904_003466 [Melospiza melodia maxima]
MLIPPLPFLILFALPGDTGTECPPSRLHIPQLFPGLLPGTLCQALSLSHLAVPGPEFLSGRWKLHSTGLCSMPIPVGTSLARHCYNVKRCQPCWAWHAKTESCCVQILLNLLVCFSEPQKVPACVLLNHEILCSFSPFHQLSKGKVLGFLWFRAFSPACIHSPKAKMNTDLTVSSPRLEWMSLQEPPVQLHCCSLNCAGLNPSRDWDLGQPKSTAEQNSGSQGRGVEFRGSSRRGRKSREILHITHFVIPSNLTAYFKRPLDQQVEFKQAQALRLGLLDKSGIFKEYRNLLNSYKKDHVLLQLHSLTVNKARPYCKEQKSFTPGKKQRTVATKKHKRRRQNIDHTVLLHLLVKLKACDFMHVILPNRANFTDFRATQPNKNPALDWGHPRWILKLANILSAQAHQRNNSYMNYPSHFLCTPGRKSCFSKPMKGDKGTVCALAEDPGFALINTEAWMSKRKTKDWLYSGWHSSKERQQQMKFYSQLVCAALHMKHEGFRSGQCVLCTSPNISGITLALHKSARISKGHSEMVGQIFHVFSLETKVLTFFSMLKNITEKFQKVLLKDLSLWKYPFLRTLPQVVTGLSKTLCIKFCNAVAQVSKGSQHSTVRQCPAARVFSQNTAESSSSTHSYITSEQDINSYFIYTRYERMIDNFWCLFSVSILIFLLMRFRILLLVYTSRIDCKLRGQHELIIAVSASMVTQQFFTYEPISFPNISNSFRTSHRSGSSQNKELLHSSDLPPYTTKYLKPPKSETLQSHVLVPGHTADSSHSTGIMAKSLSNQSYSEKLRVGTGTACASLAVSADTKVPAVLTGACSPPQQEENSFFSLGKKSHNEAQQNQCKRERHSKSQCLMHSQDYHFAKLYYPSTVYQTTVLWLHFTDSLISSYSSLRTWLSERRIKVFPVFLY